MARCAPGSGPGRARRAAPAAAAAARNACPRKDGEDFPGRNRAPASVQIDRRDVHVICLRDMTERPHAEQALRDSEARYRTLVETAPEVIVVIDTRSGRCIDANENALRFFGVAREQLGTLELARAVRPPASAAAARRRRRTGPRVFEWVCRGAGRPGDSHGSAPDAPAGQRRPGAREHHRHLGAQARRDHHRRASATCSSASPPTHRWPRCSRPSRRWRSRSVPAMSRRSAACAADGQGFAEVIGRAPARRACAPQRSARQSTCATVRAPQPSTSGARCWSPTCAPIPTGSAAASSRSQRGFRRGLVGADQGRRRPAAGRAERLSPGRPGKPHASASWN